MTAQAPLAKSSKDSAEPRPRRVLDFVITVCDDAANEALPDLSRANPCRAHWGLLDPAKAEGTEAERSLAPCRDDARVHRAHRHFRQSAARQAVQALVARRALRDRPPEPQSADGTRCLSPRETDEVLARRVDKGRRPTYVSPTWLPGISRAFARLWWGSAAEIACAFLRLNDDAVFGAFASKVFGSSNNQKSRNSGRSSLSQCARGRDPSAVR